MAQTSLERRVQDAEAATGGVVLDQRRRVEEAVPARLPPTEAQRLESSTQAAVDSTQGLTRTGTMVRAFLEARVARRQDPERAEAAYRSMEGGTERPALFYADASEARAHTQSMLGVAIVQIGAQAEKNSRKPDIPVRQRSDENLAEAQEAVDGYAATTARNWFTREFLGDTVFGRFSASPPVVTAEDESYFTTLALANGSTNPAMYFSGTNHIIVGAQLPEQGEAQAYHIIVHEQLHYACFLGGGDNIRWRDGDGAPGFRNRTAWRINEGLTELFAQHLCTDNGFPPETVGYPYETSICFVMEQAVGRDALLRAYLSGDYTEVRTLLDARMGAGTFDTLIAEQLPANAYSYLLGQASAAGMDYQSFEADPIYSQALRQVSAERQR